jgi:hypothetical protein
MDNRPITSKDITMAFNGKIVVANSEPPATFEDSKKYMEIAKKIIKKEESEAKET